MGLVVPTIDPELAALSSQARTFQEEGVFVLVSVPRFVALCRGKRVAGRHFKDEGLDVPASWLPDAPVAALPAEVFLKPRNGSGSSHIHRCRREDLQWTLPSVPGPMIQEVLGGTEITVDAFLDFQGRPIYFVPRERIRTLGGESIQGVTLDLPELDPWLVRVRGLFPPGRPGAADPAGLPHGPGPGPHRSQSALRRGLPPGPGRRGRLPGLDPGPPAGRAPGAQARPGPRGLYMTRDRA